jgi:hypothetical protein
VEGLEEAAMFTRAPRLLSRLALGGALLLPAALAANVQDDARQVLDCARASLPQRSSEQRLRLRTREATGEETTYRGTLYWTKEYEDRSRTMLRIEAPQELRGTGLLVIEREGEQPSDRFIYLPSLEKARRISKHTTRGSLLGTNLTYEDIERIQGTAKDSQTLRLADAQLDGAATHVLESRPGIDAPSRYQRVVSHFQSGTCVLLRVEYYDASGVLRKTLAADPARITREGAAWIPRSYHIQDHLDGSETWMEVEDVFTEKHIARSVFTLHGLEIGR